MEQMSKIPPFQGDESPQDAEKWLNTLVACTGGFTDSGIFRLLTTRLFCGSPAGEWFDKLDEVVKEKWAPFEKQFRARWIAEPQRQASQAAGWNSFTNHFLNVDEFFSFDMPSYDDLDIAIGIWVEEHIRLGKETGLDDTALITATLPILPPFISAYLQANFKPPYPDFRTYCTNICEMRVQFLDMERIRRQMLTGRNASMEKKVDEISELVKQLVVVKNENAQTHNEFPTTLLNEPASSKENGKLVASSGEGTSKETSGSVSKKDLVDITHRAIEFMLTFGDLNIDQANIFLSTLAIYDGLISGKDHNRRVMSTSYDCGAKYYDMSSGLRHILSYTTYKDESHLTSASDMWNDTVNDPSLDNRSIWRVITPSQTGLYTSGRNLQLHMQPSGEPTMVGGLFVPAHDGKHATISPIHTILFMILSSYLAECTGEGKYTEYALRSAHCIKNWMIDPATSLLKDCAINALTAEGKVDAILSCHLSGMAIEGFSVLASVTGDESWRSLSITMAVTAMHYGDWHSSSGVLTVGCNGIASENTDIKAFKGLLNRGLLVAYQRNRSNELFCNLVRDYINVQCDSILNFSRFHNSYGLDWRGPPPGPFTAPYAHAQMPTIDTFVAGIGVNDINGYSPSSLGAFEIV